MSEDGAFDMARKAMPKKKRKSRKLGPPKTSRGTGTAKKTDRKYKGTKHAPMAKPKKKATRKKTAPPKGVAKSSKNKRTTALGRVVDRVRGAQKKLKKDPYHKSNRTKKKQASMPKRKGPSAYTVSRRARKNRK